MQLVKLRDLASCKRGFSPSIHLRFAARNIFVIYSRQVRLKRPDVRCPLGFSVQNGIICSILRGGLAERGGVRVGHRIIEINGSSVVAVAHEKIVSVLANSVGEIQMKTMPTSIFRLLTGQETPQYI